MQNKCKIFKKNEEENTSIFLKTIFKMKKNIQKLFKIYPKSTHSIYIMKAEDKKYTERVQQVCKKCAKSIQKYSENVKN